MATDGVFLRTHSGLSVLTDTPYDSESILQEALAEYPQVIAGPTTSGQENRLLFIEREMGVPASEQGSSVFSLDHLFVDSEGVPVLVEVKRSSDTRIRREVVGQMLDYAANAVRYWPLPDVRTALEDRASHDEKTVEELLSSELGWELSADQFLDQLYGNLRSGHVRLIFVADALPERLCRIIEFLNEQMSPAEVLGVELRQFQGDGHTVYVPRVVGRTSMAVATKSESRSYWDRESLLSAVESSDANPEEVVLMRRLLDHAEEQGTKLSWGKGTSPGVSGWYDVDAVSSAVWVLRTNSEVANASAYLAFYFAELAKKGGVERVQAAAELLATIPALAPKIAHAEQSEWQKWPAVYLKDVVGSPERIQTIFDAIDLLRGAATGDVASTVGPLPDILEVGH
jgi:hypothetical protein